MLCYIMYLSRILFKKPRANHHALARTIDFDFLADSPANYPLKGDKQRWVHAELVRKGSREMHMIDYQSNFLRLFDTDQKDRLSVGVYQCVLKYKEKQVDNIRSLVSVWPLSERNLVEVLLENNEHIPKDVRQLKLLPLDQISDRAWHSMPPTNNRRKLKELGEHEKEEMPQTQSRRKLKDYARRYSETVEVSGIPLFEEVELGVEEEEEEDLEPEIMQKKRTSSGSIGSRGAENNGGDAAGRAEAAESGLE